MSSAHPRREAAALLALIAMTGCSASNDERGARGGDERDCRARLERSWDAPALRLEDERPPLEPRGTSACLSDGFIQIGDRRVPFDATRAGDSLSAALSEALPKPGGRGLVNVWAPDALAARHVLLVARAFTRAGVTVRLVAQQDASARELAPIPPPRPETFPAEGVVPTDVDVWVEMGAGELAIGRTDGGWIPIELDAQLPDARWQHLTEMLREERLTFPDRHRLVFVVRDGVEYADWARALEIAAQEGFDEIELTPIGALEALREEVGLELLRRQGGVHPLPRVERAPAVMPPEYAAALEAPASDSAADRIPSRVEIGPMQVGGYLDEVEVERVVRSRIGELSFCHERAPGPEEQRERRAILAFAVDASGRVRSVAVVRPPGSPDAGAVAEREPLAVCLRAQVAAWVFPASRTASIAGVRLPVTLGAHHE